MLFRLGLRTFAIIKKIPRGFIHLSVKFAYKMAKLNMHTHIFSSGSTFFLKKWNLLFYTVETVKSFFNTKLPACIFNKLVTQITFVYVYSLFHSSLYIMRTKICEKTVHSRVKFFLFHVFLRDIKNFIFGKAKSDGIMPRCVFSKK